MRLIITLLFFTLETNIFCQDDDLWLDPKPNKIIISNKNIDQNTIDYPVLKLENFYPGHFLHSEILSYSENIIRVIENLEKKNNIIRITIRGFADGLKNEHLVKNKNLPNECLKYADYDKGMEDIQLATIRACYTESIIKEILSRKLYFIYVDFDQTYYDEPDGGKIGPAYRKVETTITYKKR